MTPAPARCYRLFVGIIRQVALEVVSFFMDVVDAVHAIKTIDERTKHMANEISDLQTQTAGLVSDVAKETDVIKSAIVAFQGINSLLSQVEAGSITIGQARSTLMSNIDALSAAIPANTGSTSGTSPTPPAPPTPPPADGSAPTT